MEGNRTVCFTGHRDISFFSRERLRRALECEIERQIQLGAVHFRTGGAIGFDTMAALAVLKLKDKYPHIRLELILPFPDQAKSWSMHDSKLYGQILQCADSCSYVSEHYYNGVYLHRNDQLLRDADVCIAYLKQSDRGGSAYTCARAVTMGLDFVNLGEACG
ncbi:MAG: DUF1273 family protein [Clostridia bacterium]|nr:DUF1273 family protein [Clostridia bacterium]